MLSRERLGGRQASTSETLSRTDDNAAAGGSVTGHFGHEVVRLPAILESMAETVVPTSEVRAALGQITKRFDAGDPEPVFFGSHRRAQAVLVPIATWEKLLAYAEDELDLDVARRRLADRRPWLAEEDLDAAVSNAMEKASGSGRA
jgi:hypothetical protein